MFWISIDRILPQNLETAVIQAGESAGIFLNAGGTRAIVRILLQTRTWASLLNMDVLQCIKMLGNKDKKRNFQEFPSIYCNLKDCLYSWLFH